MRRDAVGGPFRFANGQRCHSCVLDPRPPHVLVLDYLGGAALFGLTPDGKGGTDLLLTHEGIALNEWQETHAGWLTVLLPLEAWALWRIDLPAHVSDRTWGARSGRACTGRILNPPVSQHSRDRKRAQRARRP